MKTSNKLTEIIRSIVSIGLMLLIICCLWLGVTNQLNTSEKQIFISFTMCISSILFLLINKSNN